MATTRKPKKAILKAVTSKKATQRDLSPKKNPKGGGTTLPNLSSGAQVGSAPVIALNKIPGPDGKLVM